MELATPRSAVRLASVADMLPTALRSQVADLVPFHSGQVRNFCLLVLDKYKEVNAILYFILD